MGILSRAVLVPSFMAMIFDGCPSSSSEKAQFVDIEPLEDDQTKVETIPLVRCPKDRLEVRWKIESPTKFTLLSAYVELNGTKRTLYQESLQPEELESFLSVPSLELLDSALDPAPNSLKVSYEVRSEGGVQPTDPHDTDKDEVRTVYADEIFQRKSFRRSVEPQLAWHAVIPAPAWSTDLLITRFEVQIPSGISNDAISGLQLQVDKNVDTSFVLNQGNGFSAILPQPTQAVGTWVISAVSGTLAAIRKFEELAFSIVVTCPQSR